VNQFAYAGFTYGGEGCLKVHDSQDLDFSPYSFTQSLTSFKLLKEISVIFPKWQMYRCPDL
jgi:hypothetical protein